VIIVKATERDREALREIYVDPEILKNDGKKYHGLRVDKPWGYEICRYEDKNCAVWWLHIDPLKETSIHCHPNKATTLLMRGGEATLTTLHAKHELTPGMVVIIEAGAFHRTTSNGGPVVLYEMEFPNNKRDLIRLTDSYSRGQGYETNTHRENSATLREATGE
jgi:mannose-6-phosphate isomerase-like protein (cupin superfamily)